MQMVFAALKFNGSIILCMFYPIGFMEMFEKYAYNLSVKGREKILN